MHPERAIEEYDDRRSEPRVPASGVVMLQVVDPFDIEVAGHLLDVSARGFRARHSCRGLHSGQIVGFHHSTAKGRARVVWNRIDSDQVETGFFIL